MDGYQTIFYLTIQTDLTTYTTLWQVEIQKIGTSLANSENIPINLIHATLKSCKTNLYRY